MLSWCLKLMRYNLYGNLRSLQDRKAGITSHQHYKSFDQLFTAGHIRNEAGWQDLTNFKRNGEKFNRCFPGFRNRYYFARYYFKI